MTAVLAAAVLGGTAVAQVVLPTGLAPGSQYGIAFVTSGPTTWFRYTAGIFKPSWATAPQAEIHIWPTGCCRAIKEIVSIAGVDEATQTVNLQGKECVGSLGLGDRYFVENVFEELDSPGEWYLNRQTGEV